MKQISKEDLQPAGAPGDGWYIIEAAGEHMTRVEDTELVQRLTPEVLAAVVAAGVPAEGLPIDRDHLSLDSDNSTEAMGWVRELAMCGSDLAARIEWTSLGLPLIKGRVYKHFSTVYPPPTVEQLASGTYVPDRLIGLALTNQPNNKTGQPPITNSLGRVGEVRGANCDLRIDNPYPPFDYNSGMRVRPVDFEVCEELGLVSVEDMDALEAEMQAQKESLNADVQASIEGLGEDLIDAVQNQLQGLVRREHTRDGDVLVMTDPNGTKPCKWDEVGKVISAPLPEKFKNNQLHAFEKWILDSRAYAPPDKREGVPPASLNEFEDMNRLIQRIEPTTKKGEDDKSEPAMLRGLTNPSEEARLQFLRSIRKNGYGVRPGFIAESWGVSMRTAKEFSASAAPMVLVCQQYRSRKRIDGIYRHADDLTPTPHKPKRVEGESLFAANVRFRYLRDELKDGILYVYVEEI